jgi:hypothetical protein
MWARKTILQCCHNQSSLDLFGVVYFGSMEPDAIFYPHLLSGWVIQVKLKEAADTNAERNLRPLGIPRHLDQPLPYLALVMELGTETAHQGTHSKLKSTASEIPSEGHFRKLTDDFAQALQDLVRAQESASPERTSASKQRKSASKKRIEQLKAKVEEKRLAMDFCNRYSISVRGASPDVYGILKEADIVEQFANLLRVTMPSPTPEDKAIQHMRPHDGANADWMRDYATT